jgi:hypothetical protein
MGDPAEENDPPPESVVFFSDWSTRVNEKSKKIYLIVARLKASHQGQATSAANSKAHKRFTALL